MTQPPPAAGRLGVGGWILFDLAAQPFFTLVTTFIFAPYFAARVAASPVEGQALWGFATGAAGLAIALLSPVFGAIADAGGRRKPWIAGFSVPLVLGCGMLWFAVPGGEWAVAIALAGFALATIGAEFATVFTNAMMVTLVEPRRLGRLSGTGWAIGYVGGLASLVLMLALFVAGPPAGLTLAGIPPLFGLDPATGAGDRLSGPFSALWYLVFVLPLFLFTPDTPRLMGVGAAVGVGWARLKQTLRNVRHHRNALTFLVAHMVYVDGIVALFAFGGLYATGIFGWSTTEIGLFGILLTVTGAIGAVVGGRLDDLVGPKRVVGGALACLILAGIGILSITADRVLFVIEVAPPHADGDLFAATAERAYLAFGVLIGLVAGPLQAASRTLLIAVSPRERITEFFGLYALSGKVTSFMGPIAVGTVTALTDSQRAGMSVLVAFFAIGALLLMRVEAKR